MSDDLDRKSKDQLVAELRTLYAEREVRRGNPDHALHGVSAAEASNGRFEAERTRRVEAERIGKVKDEFLANLSHELRAPLNTIYGWSQLLRPGKSSDAEMAEGLGIIQRSVRAQVKLIDDLLDMSRIISGKLRLDVQRVDLSACILAAIEAVQLAADAKGVRIEAIVDPVAGPVTGDPARVQQVVLNLLSNAVKFTPRGGKVQITLERVNSGVELSVSDTGRGMDPEFLPHVFDKFSQAESPSTKSTAGLGLGLAIVKSLVELHGGSIRAKSPGPGKGATFIVSLPISVVRTTSGGSDRQHPATGAAAEFTAGPDLAGIVALVVDDDADALELVKQVLGGCGASVTACSSAAQCLAVLPDLKPNVLVTDIGMPVMDGYALIRQVRALPAGQGGQTPAVALTAFARSEDRRQAMLAGFDAHVAKPVEPGELVAVVARLARRA